MGDVLTLIEQAQRNFDAEQAEKMAAKLAADEDFTLDDFLSQLAMLRNMGSLKKMLGMLPGMGELREQLDSFDEREVDRVEAIIKSMTPQERRQPRILNGSRRSRVARGSGVEVSEVNQLLERFADAQKAMRAMRKGMGGGGMPGLGGMPGMPGLPGMGGGKKSRGRNSAPPRKGKGRAKSGNPAKRAQQERESTQRAVPQEPAKGRAFGLDAQRPQEPADPSTVKLPPGFERFLGG